MGIRGLRPGGGSMKMLLMAGKAKANVAAPDGPSAITPSIVWVGGGGWGQLRALTTAGDGNIYLLRGRGFDVLIDAGAGSVLPLERNLRQLGDDPRRVREVWLTHLHSDHSGGAAVWQRRHGSAVRLSARGAGCLRRGDLRLVGGLLAGARPTWTTPAKFLPLRPGQRLRCPPHELTAVPLPGHTPDCVGFRGRIDGLDVLFSGDAIIGDQPPALGVVGWLDGLWQSSVSTYVQTLRAVLAEPPELLLPGHGVGQAGPAVRRSLKNCLARLAKVQAIPHAHTMFPFMG